MLAISPFLSRGRLDRLSSISSERTLISRAETLDEIGPAALEGWNPHVLQALAEPNEAGESDEENETSAEPGTAGGPANEDGFADPRTGLHAKTIICDLPGGVSQVVTGSANLTEAAWSRNVEFGAVLEGRTDRVGVAATLEGLGKDVPGLNHMLEAYLPEATQEEVLEGLDTWAIEEFHHRIASANPMLRIEQTGEQAVRANLELALPDDSEGLAEVTTVWPLALPEATNAQALRESLEWEHASDNISPFLAVATTVGTGKEQLTRRCVIVAELKGDLPDRAQNAVLNILRNRADVLRYLVFLLGDPTYDALLGALDGEAGAWNSPAAGGHNVNIALFEPLVRAIGRDTAELAQIADLVRDLREIDASREDSAEPLLPEGLDDLWDAVWQAHVAEVGDA